MAKTRKKIETVEQLWDSVIEDAPLDERGPRWEKRESVALWPILVLALLCNATFSILSVKLWNWLSP